MERLTVALLQAAQQDRDKGVLLFADKTIDYGTLFAVMEHLNQAGLHRISLQADSGVRP
jgi:biopolymer transport protein ExbD